jgi:hypothetical protein
MILCEKNTNIFLKILKILLMLCKSCTENSEKIRGGDCNIPKDEPYCNHVLQDGESSIDKMVGLCVY